MLASEIITQLAVKLPQLTSRFTDSIPIMTAIRDVVSGGGTGLLITCECSSQHNMQPGQAVAITNADTVILQDTLTRVGTVGTLVTAAQRGASAQALVAVTAENRKAGDNVIAGLDV